MRKSDIQKKILESATYLFSINGYQNVTVEQIAEVSRKSKGAFYYHFDSKKAVYIEIILKEIEKIKSSLLSVSNNIALPADKKLKSFMIHRLFLINESKTYIDALKNDFFKEFQELAVAKSEFDAWLTSKYHEILQKGIAEGVFPELKNQNSIVSLYVMVQKGLEYPLFIDQKYDEFIFQMEEIYTMLINSLKATSKVAEDVI